MSTNPAGDQPVSTVPEDVVVAAAERLAEAARTRITCAPIRDLIDRDDVATAYRIQEKYNALRTGGTPVVGRKIGATSLAIQQQLGVDQPDFGVLYEDMGFVDGDEIPIDGLLQARAEAEVAFVLSKDLAEGELDEAQCADAVEYAVAAIEIVDSRITDWDISFADTVADNASSGLYVLGTKRLTLDEFAPVDAVMSMTVDGEVKSEGNGAACLGDPLTALSWLARRAREFGDPLKAGQVILSGALGPLTPVWPGSTVVATIEPFGIVSASFKSGNFGTPLEEA